jgi:hypothetical protein
MSCAVIVIGRPAGEEQNARQVHVDPDGANGCLLTRVFKKLLFRKTALTLWRLWVSPDFSPGFPLTQIIFVPAYEQQVKETQAL